MAITVHEHFESRQGPSGNFAGQNRKYIVRGTDDDVTVRIAVAQSSPVVLDLFLDGTNIIYRQSIDPNPLGGGVWDVFVSYSTVFPANESSFTFETGGGTAHIERGRGTQSAYWNPALVDKAPDTFGVIGFDGESIAGTDIPVPVYHFAETHYFPPTLITGAYKSLLSILTGAVNNATFRDFDRGEVMYLGAGGSKRGAGDWEITFQFAASPNSDKLVSLGIDPLTIPGITQPQEEIDKLGWDYLWVRYEDSTDDVAKKLVKRPLAAYVDRVSYFADFSYLGIGT